MLLLRQWISNIFGNNRSHLYIPSRVENQIKIVKTSVCLFCCLCWGRSGIVFLKTPVFEPPGHHLCSPEPGRSVYVISIQKGVNVTSEEKRLVRKRNSLLCIPHRRDLNQYSQNACFCMCSLWPLPLTYFSHHWQYMNQVNYWFICFPQSSFHICPLWPWSFIPDLEINRDHPLTMDNKCTCTKFDQD